ncbi:hypothetical protein GCM10008015_28040 [Flavobacterium palustre]|uniref:TIR domain-containing protein n=1 Tax=Flavobacterium palustre TaxID=1476463 RepID=A0ABQ1HQ38_9FLAO|nr:leucine-rich repeat domain-containing protein [Flavobacterium palustre]GGA85707.1 hypothetical protein GCM10008015_28040 [Flavobacterium palustre]
MEKAFIKSKNITKLDLSNSGLKEFPKEIFELKNLRKLNLSNNNIKAIPKEISNLKLLEVLDLSNNRITNFYAKICELKKLKSLNLNNNKISSIPKQISNLKKLRNLSIANNKITALPEEFSCLDNLNSLNISKNLLTEFPNPIYFLKNIESLWITNLPIKKFNIPFITENLKKLKSIFAYTFIIDKSNIDYDYLEISKIKGNCIDKVKEISSNYKIRTYSSPASSNKMIASIEKTEKPMIFISYSHKDKKDWLSKVQTHLKVLNHQNIDFDFWDDTRIKAGQKWKEEIEKALNRSIAAILIISTDFLASDFVQKKEIPQLLNSANEKGTKLISLIIKPCRFKNQIGLNDLQAINDPDNSLINLSEGKQEEILVKLTDRIEEIILENR